MDETPQESRRREEGNGDEQSSKSEPTESREDVSMGDAEYASRGEVIE